MYKPSIINEFKLGDEYKNLEKKQTEINSLQDKIKNIDEKNRIEINFLQGKLNTNKQNIINEFKLGDEYKNLEINLNRYKNSSNQFKGDELERFISDQLEVLCGGSNNSINFKPQYKIGKPNEKGIDFLVKIKSSNEIRILIECKSGETDQSSAGIRQLKKYNEEIDSDYQILVTNTLDNYKNFNIIKHDEMKNIYIMRPYYLIYFISIINILSTKYGKLINDLENTNLEIKNKQTVIKEIYQIKEELFKGSFKYINENLKIALKHSNTIKESNIKLHKCIELIINNHIEAFEKKVKKALNIKIINKTYEKNNIF